MPPPRPSSLGPDASQRQARPRRAWGGATPVPPAPRSDGSVTTSAARTQSRASTIICPRRGNHRVRRSGRNPAMESRMTRGTALRIHLLRHPLHPALVVGDGLLVQPLQLRHRSGPRAHRTEGYAETGSAPAGTRPWTPGRSSASSQAMCARSACHQLNPRRPHLRHHRTPARLRRQRLRKRRPPRTPAAHAPPRSPAPSRSAEGTAHSLAPPPAPPIACGHPAPQRLRPLSYRHMTAIRHRRQRRARSRCRVRHRVQRPAPQLFQLQQLRTDAELHHGVVQAVSLPQKRQRDPRQLRLPVQQRVDPPL
jgi:hypothetical protein